MPAPRSWFDAAPQPPAAPSFTWFTPRTAPQPAPAPDPRVRRRRLRAVLAYRAAAATARGEKARRDLRGLREARRCAGNALRDLLDLEPDGALALLLHEDTVARDLHFEHPTRETRAETLRTRERIRAALASAR